MNKRVVIGVIGAVLGVAVLGGVALAVGGIGEDRRVGAVGSQGRAYAAGHFFLEIDGTKVGAVSNVRGCAAAGDVIQAQAGADKVVRKHIGNLAYEPCVIEAGAGLDGALYKWIADMLDRKATAKNLTIVSTDYDYTARSSTQLTNALLTKVSLPTLDAGSKDSAKLQLTIQADTVKTVAGSGTKYAVPLGKSGTQKAWLPQNFRFSLDGVTDLNRVNKISAFEATQKVVQSDIGEVRDYQKEPAALELGHLAITIAESHSASLDAWFDDFLIKGNSTAASEKNGKIEFLSANLQDVLFTLSLKGVGIFRGGEQTFDAGSEAIKRKTYSLYIEEASFTVGVPTSTTTPQPSPSPSPTPAPTPTPTPPPAAPTAGAAQGAITPIAGAELIDGESFTISDGKNPPTTFEFDSDGSAEATAVPFAKDDRPESVGEAIAAAINGVEERLLVSAKSGESVELQNDTPGVVGNVPIGETVSNELFAVKGMSGGSGGEEKTEPETSIPAPATLKAETGGAEGEVNLSWEPSAGAVGYVVYFATDKGDEPHPIYETTETTVTLGGLKSGLTHYFVVRAYTKAGESDNSPQASAAAG